MKTRRNSGVKSAAEAEAASFSLISDAKLKQIYITMLQCRVFAEYLNASVKQIQFARSHLASVGMEATLVGVTIDLCRGDLIAPSGYDLATMLIKGIPPAAIVAKLSKPSTDSDASQNGVATRPSISAQLKLAVDAAQLDKNKDGGKVIVAFTAQAHTASWQKALAAAGRNALPMLFVVQQDLSVLLPGRKQQATTSSNGYKAEDPGFPAIPVDGNDAVAVYRVAFEAMVRARQGGGPTLIECKPYLYPADPIHMMEDYLTRKHLFTSKWKQQTLRSFEKKLQEGTHPPLAPAPSSGE